MNLILGKHCKLRSGHLDRDLHGQGEESNKSCEDASTNVYVHHKPARAESIDSTVLGQGAWLQVDKTCLG